MTNYPTTVDTNEELSARRVNGPREEEHIDTLVAAVKALETSMLGGATFTGSGLPASGTAGTGAGTASPGASYADMTNSGIWVNTGTLLSPYWEPQFAPGYGNTWGVYSDFRDGVGKTEADTATSVTLASGIIVLGDGVHESDCGAVVNELAEGGNAGIRLLCGATAGGDLAALTYGPVSAAGCYQPDVHGRAILDVEVAHLAAITARIFGCGFAGLTPVGMTDIVTLATTILTLVDDDLFAVFMGSTATDADRLYVGHNKSNEAATIDATVDTAIDTDTDMAAAGTRQRFRVEIDADGKGRILIDKVLVYEVAAQVDVNEELNPFVYVSPTTTTDADMDVFHYLFIAAKS